MQTQSGKRIDNYWNRYDAGKKYMELLFRDGYGTQASEMNELQSLFAARVKSLADSLFKDGDILQDAQITVNAQTGALTAEAGLVYLSGAVWPVETASFVIPVQGTVSVGVRLRESIISELEDPALCNPAVGSRGEGEPGAWRKKVEAVWGYDGDGGSGEFYPIHTVDDGVPRAKETPPNLDSFNQGIARYDRDSTGGGTYVCSGLTVRQAEDAGGGAQVYTVAEGRCRVSGYGVELLTSRRLSYAATPDLRFIDTEVIEADGSGKQRINVAHPPIHNITALRVTLQKTVSVVHGSYSGCADALPDTSVMSLVEVKQGETTYEAGTDYKRTGDTVDWSPTGNEPATGSTYQVTYTYLDKTLTPEDPDYDGFSVSGAVSGTGIMVSYNQALPRIDRLCITGDGTFTWVQGVAAEYNAKAPSVPETVLALCSVKQTWREASARVVQNDGVRVVAFSDMEALAARVEYALQEVARQLSDPAHCGESLCAVAGHTGSDGAYLHAANPAGTAVPHGRNEGQSVYGVRHSAGQGHADARRGPLDGTGHGMDKRGDAFVLSGHLCAESSATRADRHVHQHQHGSGGHVAKGAGISASDRRGV